MKTSRGFDATRLGAHIACVSNVKLQSLERKKKEKKKERKKRKTTQAAKCSLHQLRKRGHLGRKAPSPEKKKAVSEDQEGCGQTSQQTSPDWFEGAQSLLTVEPTQESKLKEEKDTKAKILKVDW